MGKGARVAYGGLTGAAGGAGLGTAILPGIGTAIGAGLGGLAGALGAAFGEDGVSEEDIQKQREFLRRKQALERQQSAYQDDMRFAQVVGGSSYAPNKSPSFEQDPYLMTMPAQRGMQRRGQQLQADMFEEDARRQLEGQDPTWQDWMGASMNAAGQVVGAVKGMNGDPRQYRKANLRSAADEADFIRAGAPAYDGDTTPLSGSLLKTALEENDERTKAALFGSKRRMSPYDF